MIFFAGILLSLIDQRAPKPENVKTMIINETSVLLSWSTVLDLDNDCILQYVIRFDDKSVTTNGDRSYTITNLVRKEYNFSVASMLGNMMHVSNWSDPAILIFDGKQEVMYNNNTIIKLIVPVKVTNVTSIPPVINCANNHRSNIISFTIAWKPKVFYTQYIITFTYNCRTHPITQRLPILKYHTI